MRLLSVIITLSLFLMADSALGGPKKRGGAPESSTDGPSASSSSAVVSEGVVAEPPFSLNLAWFEPDFKDKIPDSPSLTDLQIIQKGDRALLKGVFERHEGFEKLQLLAGQFFRKWFAEGQIDKNFVAFVGSSEISQPLVEQFRVLLQDMRDYLPRMKKFSVPDEARLDQFARFFGTHFLFNTDKLDPFSCLLLGGGLIGFRYAESRNLPITPYKSILWEIGTSLFSHLDGPYVISPGLLLEERKRWSARYLQLALFTEEECKKYPGAPDRWAAIGELILEGWVIHWKDKLIPMHGREEIAEECFQLGKSPAAFFNRAKLMMERACSIDPRSQEAAKVKERADLLLRAALDFRLSGHSAGPFYIAEMVQDHGLTEVSFHFTESDFALLSEDERSRMKGNRSDVPLRCMRVTDENRREIAVRLYREAGSQGLIRLGDRVLRGEISPGEAGIEGEIEPVVAAARLYNQASSIVGKVKNARLLLKRLLLVNPFDQFKSFGNCDPQAIANKVLATVVRLGQLSLPEYKDYPQVLAAAIAEGELDSVPDLNNPDRMIAVTPRNRGWIAGRLFLLSDTDKDRVKGGILLAKKILSLSLREADEQWGRDDMDEVLKALLEVEDQPAQEEARRLAAGLLLKGAYTPALFTSEEEALKKAAALFWLNQDCISCQVLGDGIPDGRFPLNGHGQPIPVSQRLDQGALLSQLCGLSGGWRQLGGCYLHEGLGQDFTNGEVLEEDISLSNARRLALRRAWFCYKRALEMDPEDESSTIGLILAEGILDKSRISEALEELKEKPLPDAAVARAYLLWEQGIDDKGQVIEPENGAELLDAALRVLTPLMPSPGVIPEEMPLDVSLKSYPQLFHLHTARICYAYGRTLIAKSDPQLKSVLERVVEAYRHVRFPFYTDMLRLQYANEALFNRVGEFLEETRKEGATEEESVPGVRSEERETSPKDSSSESESDGSEPVSLSATSSSSSGKISPPESLIVHSSQENQSKGNQRYREFEDPAVVGLLQRWAGASKPQAHTSVSASSPAASLLSEKRPVTPPRPQGVWGQRKADADARQKKVEEEKAEKERQRQEQLAAEKREAASFREGEPGPSATKPTAANLESPGEGWKNAGERTRRHRK